MRRHAVAAGLPHPVKELVKQARPRLVSSADAARRRLPGLSRMHGEVALLGTRVTVLEQAVQDERRANRELAEVVDVVQQVVIPSVLEEGTDLDALVDKYAAFI